jgi:hypothetical protein
MTLCNLLNIARVKQIVPRSQIWHYGSIGSQIGGKLLPSAQSSSRGQTVGENRSVKVTVPVSSMQRLAKSDKMALLGSKLGFVSDLELIPLGQFSQYVVPPV